MEVRPGCSEYVDVVINAGVGAPLEADGAAPTTAIDRNPDLLLNKLSQRHNRARIQSTSR